MSETAPPAPHWNEDEKRQLAALWNEGISTLEIGRRMGKSKNAVIGKADRLGLPRRPSPLGRGRAPNAKPASGNVPRIARAAKVAPPEPPPPPPPVRASRDTCLWAAGDAGRWILCCEPAVGGAFCEKHVALAYVPRSAKAA